MKKKKNQFNPFENLVLDEYEQKIESAIERGDYVSTDNLEEVKKMFKNAAKRHLELKKTKRVTIRIKNEDLIKVKTKAEKHNIPYQTLINALIRQYAEGKTKLTI